MGNSPDASIDTTNITAPLVCNLTLAVTDRSGRTREESTLLTASPAPEPVPPGEVDSGNSFIFGVDESKCQSPPCTYEWTCTETTIPWTEIRSRDAKSGRHLLWSPTAGGGPSAAAGRRLLQDTWTVSGSQISVTSGVGADYNVDMTQATSPHKVVCTCKITDAQGRVTDSAPYTKVVKPLAPDCTRALAAPKALKASTKVCSGTSGVYQTINLTPFSDPQGLTVTSFHVTAITSNQLVPSCSSCRRRRNSQAQQGCTCTPAGQVLSGGSAACVLPVVAPSRRKDGRIYRITFVATSGSTLSCQGTVALCVGGSSSRRARRSPSTRANGGFVERFVPGVGGAGGEVGPDCTSTRCRPNPAGPTVCRDDGAAYDATSPACDTKG